ncbi:MAG: hypothetical protein E6R06_19960 [Mycobacterium sp.]|nr:MAG: hypothetical protein E6R06_19960 [Mycobacterium sp.]
MRQTVAAAATNAAVPAVAAVAGDGAASATSAARAAVAAVNAVDGDVTAAWSRSGFGVVTKVRGGTTGATATTATEKPRVTTGSTGSTITTEVQIPRLKKGADSTATVAAITTIAEQPSTPPAGSAGDSHHDVGVLGHRLQVAVTAVTAVAHHPSRATGEPSCAVTSLTEEPAAILSRGTTDDLTEFVSNQRGVGAVADQAAMVIESKQCVDRAEPPEVVVDEVLQVSAQATHPISTDPEQIEGLRSIRHGTHCGTSIHRAEAVEEILEVGVRGRRDQPKGREHPRCTGSSCPATDLALAYPNTHTPAPLAKQILVETLTKSERFACWDRRRR